MPNKPVKKKKKVLCGACVKTEYNGFPFGGERFPDSFISPSVKILSFSTHIKNRHGPFMELTLKCKREVRGL